MEDQTIYNVVDENKNAQEVSELSHTDKLVGILTEPSVTFEQTAKFPPRVKDWLIPVILVIVFSIISNVILMNVPTIRYQAQQNQITSMEKSLDEQVAKGEISREQADQRLEQTRNMMEKATGGIFIVIQAVSTFFMVFIVFFIISLVYFALSKLVLKGEGNFSSAMVAYGLPYYIGLIALVVMTISSLALDRLMTGTNIAAFLNMDRTTIAGYFLGKLDVFTIWALFLVGIGLAKMFHSSDTKKYLIAVFSLWILWSILLFGLAQVLTFLKPMLAYM